MPDNVGMLESPPGAVVARRLGRPAKLSRAAVIEAADTILSTAGVEAITIRGVAASLGVSPMALYRYVKDKDDLLVLLIDRLAQRLEYPPLPAEPLGRLLALWQTLYDGLAAHPWLTPVLARRRLIAPSVLGAIEQIHVAFGDAGLDLDQAVVAYRVVWQFTIGALLVRAGLALDRPSLQAAVRTAPDPRRYPTLARAATAWGHAHGHDTYATDVVVLLEALLARPRPAP